ncbi:hypothetical protein OS493_034989 [Desmophyllum pertusum]|uniref:Uncharacterized protein n=1 Tax=Desmophyllum pertusum TaxID=174260 RepID=A0A9W9Y801_9CNID|nr:hypothetical protein OS493_034989 [Desmophyllum pertusum]
MEIYALDERERVKITFHLKLSIFVVVHWWSAIMSIMAESAGSGKGSYVSLSMDDMKESRDGENEDEEKERKREDLHSLETLSVLDECLDEFNEVFRRKVRDKYCSTENISWSTASDEVKVELLTERYEDGGMQLCDDPLLVLLKKWPASAKFCENPRFIEAQSAEAVSSNCQDNPVSFQELIEHPNMKKTVVAVLNCMVSPDWRHLPKCKEDYSSQMKKDIELAWSSEPRQSHKLSVLL